MRYQTQNLHLDFFSYALFGEFVVVVRCSMSRIARILGEEFKKSVDLLREIAGHFGKILEYHKAYLRGEITCS